MEFEGLIANVGLRLDVWYSGMDYYVDLFEPFGKRVRESDDEVAGKMERVPATHEFWTWILVGALVVLLLEWYIYNRRVFI